MSRPFFVERSEHFYNAVLWQQGMENFVAVEPWNGWQNSLNEPGEHEVLQPGQSLKACCSFTLETINR